MNTLGAIVVDNACVAADFGAAIRGNVVKKMSFTPVVKAIFWYLAAAAIQIFSLTGIICIGLWIPAGWVGSRLG